MRDIITACLPFWGKECSIRRHKRVCRRFELKGLQDRMSVKRKRKSVLLRLALLAFSMNVVVMLAQLQLEIREKQAKIDALKGSIAAQQRVNENLTRQTENLEQYLRQRAYEQGWALPGEIVMIEQPGINS